MDIGAVKAYQFKSVEQRYTRRDTMLYALALGYGDVPDDPLQLQFTYEQGLLAVPSIGVVLAHPGFWPAIPELQINWVKLLHGEQYFEIKSPIPPEGMVRADYEITAVEDKGPEKGAVLYITKRLYDMANDRLLATLVSVYMLRGDGGCGGFGTVPPPPEPIPEAAPDFVLDTPTLPQTALLYRLSGDYNPIHVDPAAAAKAGFPRPILHGLCSLGLATRALIGSLADGNPARLQSLGLRFSRPVFPGETIRTEIFKTAGTVRFRARAVERDVIVLDRGTAVIAR